MKVGIVGGGIVGLATAYQLLQRFPRTQVILFEKESKPGLHQTGNNSGVLHCGLYYKPGSVKARLAVEGIRRIIDFCERFDVPHEICGKVVVATEKEEIPRLQALYERGLANGLTGLEMLGPEGIHAYEPHAAGLAGIRVPQEGIVDYRAVAAALAREITASGGEIRFSAEVVRLEDKQGWHIETRSGTSEADFIINCA